MQLNITNSSGVRTQLSDSCRLTNRFITRNLYDFLCLPHSMKDIHIGIYKNLPIYQLIILSIRLMSEKNSNHCLFKIGNLLINRKIGVKLKL